MRKRGANCQGPLLNTALQPLKHSHDFEDGSLGLTNRRNGNKRILRDAELRNDCIHSSTLNVQQACVSGALNSPEEAQL